MTFLKCINLLSAILFGSILLLSVGSAIEANDIHFSQKRDAGRSPQDKSIRTAREGELVVRPHREIPGATERCTPQECEWWNKYG